MSYRTYLKTWLIVVGVWLILGVIWAGPIYFEVQGMNHAAWRIFSWGILLWLAWAPLTPVMIWLARRFSLVGEKWLRNLAVHLPAFVLISATHSAAATALILNLRPYDDMGDSPKSFWPRFVSRTTGQLGSDLLIYCGVIGICYALDYYRKYREREFLASRLEMQLAQAQLESLRMQLHPHFLFNTLNGIVGLVRDNKNQAAIGMLVGLSDLLRHTLDHSSKHEVELKQEINFIKLYLSIQQMRFSDRLRIQYDIHPGTMHALVPNLILQPLTENALRHGISTSADSGVVGITAALEDGHLRLTVYDDGAGLPDDWQMKSSAGIGLANTAARLQQLYDDDHQFDIRNRPAGGVEVTILLPFKTSPQ